MIDVHQISDEIQISGHGCQSLDNSKDDDQRYRDISTGLDFTDIEYQ